MLVLLDVSVGVLVCALEKRYLITNRSIQHYFSLHFVLPLPSTSFSLFPWLKQLGQPFMDKPALQSARSPLPEPEELKVAGRKHMPKYLACFKIQSQPSQQHCLAVLPYL